MEKFENKNENLMADKVINDVIKNSEIEEKKLSEKIENDEKIGGYRITDKYDGFLDQSEKGFAMIISEGKAGDDDINLGIIVKYEEGKITIRDTQQEPFNDDLYNEFTLAPDEQIIGNDDVNKINKLLDSRGFPKIKGKELEKLAKKIETIKNKA